MTYKAKRFPRNGKIIGVKKAFHDFKLSNLLIGNIKLSGLKMKNLGIRLTDLQL